MKFTKLLLNCYFNIFYYLWARLTRDVALNAIKALISSNAKKLSEYFALDKVTKSQSEQSAIKNKLNEIS